MNRELIILTALLVASCGRDVTDRESAPDVLPAEPAPPAVTTLPPPAESRTVQLRATGGGNASGILAVSVRDEQVHIDGEIGGLVPNSEHGLHIHVNGDCSAPDASSSGGHFAPLGHPHGAPGTASHVGDLGNIRADANGMAQVNAIAEQASLGTGSATDVANRAIVVHAGPDDFSTQPDGNSGERLACGVIGPDAIAAGG